MLRPAGRKHGWNTYRRVAQKNGRAQNATLHLRRTYRNLSPIRQLLEDIDINRLTPVEALLKLQEIKNTFDNTRSSPSGRCPFSSAMPLFFIPQDPITSPKMTRIFSFAILR